MSLRKLPGGNVELSVDTIREKARDRYSGSYTERDVIVVGNCKILLTPVLVGLERG